MAQKKTKLLAVVLLVVLVAAAAAAYLSLRPEAQAGSKTVVLTVTHGDGSINERTLRTDAATLREAMEEAALVEGEDGPYGLFVHAVDGETVNESDQEWWCFSKDGEMLMTGVDDTMISDGEHYEAVFTVGYDAF